MKRGLAVSFPSGRGLRAVALLVSLQDSNSRTCVHSSPLKVQFTHPSECASRVPNILELENLTATLLVFDSLLKCPHPNYNLNYPPK